MAHAIESADVVAANVRYYTQRNGLKQTHLVNEFRWSQPRLNQKFTGKRDWALNDLPILARIFGVTINDLFTPMPGTIIKIHPQKAQRLRMKTPRKGGRTTSRPVDRTEREGKRARRDSNPQPKGLGWTSWH